MEQCHCDLDGFVLAETGCLCVQGVEVRLVRLLLGLLHLFNALPLPGFLLLAHRAEAEALLRAGIVSSLGILLACPALHTDLDVLDSRLRLLHGFEAFGERPLGDLDAELLVSIGPLQGLLDLELALSQQWPLRLALLFLALSLFHRLLLLLQLHLRRTLPKGLGNRPILQPGSLSFFGPGNGLLQYRLQHRLFLGGVILDQYLVAGLVRRRLLIFRIVLLSAPMQVLSQVVSFLVAFAAELALVAIVFWHGFVSLLRGVHEMSVVPEGLSFLEPLAADIAFERSFLLGLYLQQLALLPCQRVLVADVIEQVGPLAVAALAFGVVEPVVDGVSLVGLPALLGLPALEILGHLQLAGIISRTSITGGQACCYHSLCLNLWARLLHCLHCHLN